MRSLINWIAIFQTAFVLAQDGPGPSTYKWTGPCCDHTGAPSNPADPAHQIYTVKAFKKATPVELVISSITVGTERKMVNFKFKAQVASETDVLQVTDSVGVKLVLGQMRENHRNKYVYKLIVYRRDGVYNCWRPLSIFNQMLDVYAQTISLGMFALGAEGTQEFVRIDDGWMKLN